MYLQEIPAAAEIDEMALENKGRDFYKNKKEIRKRKYKISA